MRRGRMIDTNQGENEDEGESVHLTGEQGEAVRRLARERRTTPEAIIKEAIDAELRRVEEDLS